jgi:hypothetical protein
MNVRRPIEVERDPAYPDVREVTGEIAENFAELCSGL